MKQLPKALFLSHGGGPMPLLGDPGHSQMIACLKDIAQLIPKPEAVLVVSAHWEAPVLRITSGKAPSLIYDYYGFPPESYEIQYPCSGEPDLAQEVYQMLTTAGIQAELDHQRGFDHGVFVPLKLMYPEADIPCVQLSLAKSLDPEFHIQVGQALRSLHEKNVLVIGSGFSFHNLRAFFNPGSEEAYKQNSAFEDWLVETCSSKTFTENERAQRLSNWSQAQGARYCHPRAEHLIPLHLCYGVAQSASTHHYAIEILGMKSSMFLW